jgi:hypothetical protein
VTVKLIFSLWRIAEMALAPRSQRHLDPTLGRNEIRRHPEQNQLLVASRELKHFVAMSAV